MNRIELENCLDRNARRFLAAVQYYGGDATTTEIRARTGLSRTVVNHRFDVLEECGLINVTYADYGHGRRDPPKVAHLTGAARREIERGILGGINDELSREGVHDLEAEVRAVRGENAEFREMVHAFTDALRQHGDRLDDIEEDVDELYEWGEEAERAIRTLWAERDG
ncbi:MarR family transcriptional regulator [Saliphagus sp. GCM10025308]